MSTVETPPSAPETENSRDNELAEALHHAMIPFFNGETQREITSGNGEFYDSLRLGRGASTSFAKTTFEVWHFQAAPETPHEYVIHAYSGCGNTPSASVWVKPAGDNETTVIDVVRNDNGSGQPFIETPQELVYEAAVTAGFWQKYNWD